MPPLRGETVGLQKKSLKIKKARNQGICFNWDIRILYGKIS